jgi:hypothetical protein
MGFSAQRQFLVTCDGIAGYFMTKQGGEIQADSAKVYDGGTSVPEIITSPAETGNVTISRGYKQERDDAVLQNLRGKVGRYSTTIKVQQTDADLVPIGSATVYAGAVLVRLTEPDFDSSSGDPTTIEMEWAVKAAAN